MNIKGMLKSIKGLFSRITHKYITGDANLIRMKKTLSSYKAQLMVKAVRNKVLSQDRNKDITDLSRVNLFTSAQMMEIEAGAVQTLGLKGLNVNSTRRYTEKQMALFEDAFLGIKLEENEIGAYIFTEEGRFYNSVLQVLQSKGLDIYDPAQLYEMLGGTSIRELYEAWKDEAEDGEEWYATFKKDPLKWINEQLERLEKSPINRKKIRTPQDVGLAEFF